MEKKLFTFDEIKSKMLKYCVYQERCHQEVHYKLNEFVLIPEARDEILVMLIEHDFLNQERFAHAYARGKFNQKQWGKQKIKTQLKLKGISPKLIEKAIKGEINDDDYLESAKSLIQKKIGPLSIPIHFKIKKEIYDLLYRKGYETEIIQNIINMGDE
jgi:regulatory protein